MNAVDLFNLAVRYTEDATRAARWLTASTFTTDDEQQTRDRATAGRIRRRADEHREALRNTLHEALHGTVHARPDVRLPVCTHQRGTVEVRAITDDGDRSVRIRYTPAQAIAAGTALIACAAISDSPADIDLADLLGPLHTPAPTETPLLRPSIPR